MSNNTDYMLTFEISKDSDEIEIHLDSAGLSVLIETLQNLRKKSRDHSHLMTEEWAGDELSSDLQGGGSLINKVTIHKW